MARFIVMTFAFLGWAFFEMSGGTDFEPASARLTNIKADPLKPAAPTELASASKLDDLDTQVTRVSLNLTSVEDVLSGKTVRPARLPQQAEATTVSLEIAAPEQGESVSIIPSLVTGADTSNVIQAAAVVQETTFTDIREVTGNRVNVRGGPSTSFGVVNRLVRGDEVEILEDTGNGWVRLRPIDGGEEGWMADFLLRSN
ncbi:MAG: SH3 domain-containing protein [Aliishimia sp.]